MKRFLRYGRLALTLIPVLTACGGVSIRPEIRALLAPSVEIHRYAGLWYQVARYPHFFQGGRCGNTTAEYALQPDGSLSVLNRCWKTTNGGAVSQEVRATAVPEGPNSSVLIATFYGLFRAGYLIVELDTNGYQWAAVTTPDRNTLWILSREPALEQPVYDGIIDSLTRKGFDPARIIKTSRQK